MAPMILVSRLRYAMLWYISSFSSFLAVVIVIIIPCFSPKALRVRVLLSILWKGAVPRSNTIGLADDICMARWQLREHFTEVRHMLLVERDNLEEVSTPRS